MPVLTVRQIDHTAVICKDLAATRHFYVEVLGMTEVPRPAFSFEGAWFEAGGTLVHAIAAHAESGPAGEVRDPAARASRTQHTAFAVDDAVAAAEALRAAGVPIAAGPKGRPDGAAQTVVLDPDGYVVELVSETGGEKLAVDGGQSA